MKENIVKDKSHKFAIDIVKFIRSLPRDVVSYTLAKQLIRSGTSIGANIEEAIGAASKNDFIYKMTVALKESRETCYWLSIIKETNISKNGEVKTLSLNAEE